MSEEFTSGRALANMIVDVQHDARVAKAAEVEAQKHFAAGRLAGLREAAEVARKPTTIGGPSFDFAQGYADAQKRISAAILALAEG